MEGLVIKQSLEENKIQNDKLKSENIAPLLEKIKK